ncbi:MAM and LDL-receptor class A domain-containing 2-like, partial [Paramuricea clavata]
MMESLANFIILLILCTGAFAQNNGKCDFENPSGLCGYTQDTTDDFDWTRKNGATSSTGTGPSSDHTTSTGSTVAVYTKLSAQPGSATALGQKCAFPFTYRGATYTKCTNTRHTALWCSTTSTYSGKWGNCQPTGWYVYIEASGRTTSHVARLISPTLPATNSSCVRFWTHMWGPHIGALNVTMNASSTQVVWSKSGTQGNQWTQRKIDVNSTTPYNLIFSASRGIGYRGDISIDDIEITKGSCSFDPNLCTFEKDWCNYVAAGRWIRRKGRTPSGSTGPSVDHTTGSSAGYYIYYETSGAQKRNATATVQKNFTANGPKSCLQFWYHMYGRTVNTLNVYTIQNGKQLRIWSRSFNQGNTWYKAQTTVNITQGKYTLMFEAVRGTSFQGDIALDDINMKTGECILPGDCTFQTSLTTADCLWNNVAQGDKFDWIANSGGTSSYLTGPSADRKGSSSGKYLFIETSSPRQTGDKAWLISDYFNKSVSCFTFWYHMYGSSIGSLNIYQQPLGGQKVLLWKLGGNKGNKWFSGQAMADFSLKQHRIIVEGVRGSSYQGDIAVDDFKFRSGRCSIVPASASPTTPPTQTPTAKPTTAPPSNTGYNCNFESGLCSWTQTTARDKFNWTRNQGSTSSGGTGPSSDHTLGNSNGWYMYIETSSPRRQGDNARLVSDFIPSTLGTSGRCLTFYYHMYGYHTGTLNVFIKTGNHLTNVWQLNGTQGNNWLQAKTTLVSQAHFQVIFEGIRGQGYQSDISIDDVTVTRGACTYSSSKCTFEDSKVCGFTQVTDGTDNFNWIRKSGRTSTPNTGPTADHTIKTST